MLTSSEIKALITKFKKKEPLMLDARIAEIAKSWDIEDPDLSPGKLGMVYAYIKDKYVQDETMEDMQKCLGFNLFTISKALRLLESEGYVAISRSRKPFNYRVIR